MTISDDEAKGPAPAPAPEQAQALIPLPRSCAALKAFQSDPNLAQVLGGELRHLTDPTPLQRILQQALRYSSHALLEGLQLSLLARERHGHDFRLRLGVFYQGINAGCSCADDPGPIQSQEEHCLLQLDIDPERGEGRLQLLD